MKSIVLILMIVCLGVCPVAGGETAPEGKADTRTVEQILVTANKVAQDPMEVPAGITLLTETDLEDFRIRSVSDIADFTPNFHVFDTGIMGLFTPSIRGKSAESAGSSVGLYVDGVPVLSGTGFNDDLLDIERVEVLRGPQATLYGKNAQAGAVNIVSKKPGNTVRGKVSGEIGQDNKYQVTATASGPVVRDKLFVSVSGLHYEKDGMLTYAATGNEVDYKDYNYGKVNLMFTPAETFEASLILSALSHDDGTLNMNITDYYASLYGADTPKDRVVDSDLEGWNKSGSQMQVLKLSWDVTPASTLTSISTRRRYNSHYLADWDFTNLQYYHKEMDSTDLSYSQELRWTYTGETFSLLSGLYADSSEEHFVEINDVTRVVDEEHTTENRSLGVFMNTDIPIGSRFSLSSGIRFDRDDGEYDEASRSRHLDEHWDGISPRLALSFFPVSHVTTYASVSRGYLAGGFNDHAASDNPISFDQESLWSYEAGVKAAFLDDRLIVDCALFHMDIDDYQVRIDVSPEYNYTANAARAVSSGLELQARFRATDRLTLKGSLGYVHAEFEDYTDDSGSYDGNALPYSPEYSGTMGAVYRYPSGIYLSADLVGYGKMYLNKENNYPRDAYAIVNAKAGYETERWDIYVYGDNVFDKDYSTDGYFGGLYTVYSPPLEVGVQVRYRF